ncbi:hypothetical protein S83_069028 [Arachis hypogaea]
MRMKLESKKLTGRRPWRLHMLHILQMRKTSLKTTQKVSLMRTLTLMSTPTTAAPPNAATTPATSSEPAPPVTRRPIAPTPPIPPTRGRGRTTRRGTTPNSTTLFTLTQNVAATPPHPAQPRVVRHAAGSKSQIPATPTNTAGPSSGPGSMPQGPLVRPTLQAQHSATSRPPSVTRKIMAAASPATQSRFTGFMPTPSLKKKKQSGPKASKPSASNKK